jgi:hypothetical protein
MNDNRPEGFYSRYLRLLGERRRAKNEQIMEDDSEQYWRDRKKWHAEQQLPRKAA